MMACRVLVIGAGGLGSPVIQYLAAAGIGTLGIIDFDQIELHNLNRQVIFGNNDVGLSKAVVASEFVSNLNPNVRVQIYPQKLTDDNAESIFANYDIIVDGSDNFTTRYLVNDICVSLEKPLVYGSIFGFEGQLSVFNYRGSRNLRDIFPEPPASEDVPNCDKNGVLGPLPGIIGSMMAMQVLKIATDLPVDSNQLTIINTLNWQFTKLSF